MHFTAKRCREGEVRIIDRNTMIQGRVEICFDEVWGTVCNENWGQADATVVCRELEYFEYGEKSLDDNIIFKVLRWLPSMLLIII